MSIAAGLTGSRYEELLTIDEKNSLYLRARYAALTFCGCAHAVFVCELLRSLRRHPNLDQLALASSIKSKRCLCQIFTETEDDMLQPRWIFLDEEAVENTDMAPPWRTKTAARDSCASGGHGDLRVGILGLGNLGKQLLLSLLKKTSIQPTQIKISTRNPESAEECLPTGVECFFDNRRLAAWADVLFLCCLPSHLHRICADLYSHVPKHCLVYSFATAVPVTSIAERLGHTFALKPQYQLDASDTSDLWLSCSNQTAALLDPSLIEASCPLTMKGGITLGVNWVCGVLYSLLNICTSACLGSSETLSLINSIFTEKGMKNEPFNTMSFISSSWASGLDPNESFPWISLIDTKETPLLRFVRSSKSAQHSLCTAYKSYLER